ncbi:NnrU protein [Pacificibacter maritimus]|uniref:NnrU protein n=1 Tax=Pacificibacter maritimus TaxID=762213 RepID=A0A3N4V0C7_9RHOB|nr:NnrU family protein [Pacificibacter maritimus]RPE67300.1 NnrU protein [Pacificibacter maritimus]
MILIILGVVLWTGAHVFNRIAPDVRADLGEKGRILVAALSFIAIVLMVIGYKTADGPVYWGRVPALVGINNLLMLFAIYLFAASGMKTWITSKIKNPQLTAVKVWALAHLLVNGDLASFLLFGGLLAWAVWSVILIKRAGVTPEPYVPVGAKKEVMAVIGALIVTVVIMGLHAALGATPWG